jgi:hypothetical protein
MENTFCVRGPERLLRYRELAHDPAWASGLDAVMALLYFKFLSNL